MSDTWLTVFGLAALVLLIALNALFVAAEFAFVGVRRTRVEQLAAAGQPRARALLGALANLESTIAATQLGITMAGLALGWIGEPVLAGLLEPPVAAALGFAPERTGGSGCDHPRVHAGDDRGDRLRRAGAEVDGAGVELSAPRSWWRGRWRCFRASSGRSSGC